MNMKNTILVAAVIVTPSLALAEGTHAFDQGMQPILQSYLKAQAALAGDKTDGVQDAARAIATASKKLDVKSVTGEHAEHYKHLPMNLGKAAGKLAASGNIDAAREAFKELSKPMAMWGTMAKPKGIVVLFCSMAKGSWLQKKGDVRNPYYGASMLGCGEIVGGDNGDAMDHGGMGHMEHDMESGH
jgi:Cu(I)/Ag(I) efflux system membrane fusion protein